MPLSDHEQRQFEQIERTLAAEDPKFVSTVRSMDLRTHRRRRLRRSGILFIVGFGLLMGGAIAPNVYVGVVGFLAMLGAGLWGMSISKRPTAATGNGPADQAGSTKKRKNSGVSDRFEERWRKRRDDDGRPF